jgi:hypothetical protein
LSDDSVGQQGGLMKQLLMSLLLIASVDSSAREVVIPFRLQPGDHFAYDVEEYADRPGNRGTTRWTAEFVVLEASSEGSVLSCRVGLDVFGDKVRALIPRMPDKNDDFAIELVLDSDHSVAGIRNWKAVADVMDQAWKMEISRRQATTMTEQWAEIGPMLEHMRQMYSSKEYLEARLGNKFSQVFWPVGMSFDTEQPTVVESTLSIPISESPIPARVSFEVVGDNPDSLAIDIVQSIDPELGTAALVRMVKDMLPSKAADVDEKLAKASIDLRMEARAEINRSDGWVDEIEVQVHMRVMDDGGSEKTVWTRRQ